jgi:hypothetical protein
MYTITTWSAACTGNEAMHLRIFLCNTLTPIFTTQESKPATEVVSHNLQQFQTDVWET